MCILKIIVQINIRYLVTFMVSKVKIKWWQSSFEIIQKIVLIYLEFNLEINSKAFMYMTVGVQMGSDIYNTILWDCYNRCTIRRQTVSKSKLLKPWFDQELKMMCNQKHDLSRIYKRGLIHYDQYSKFNKDFSLMIKRSIK